MGQTAAGKYILAVIDQYGSVPEVNESNKLIVFGPIE